MALLFMISFRLSYIGHTENTKFKYFLKIYVVKVTYFRFEN